MIVAAQTGDELGESPCWVAATGQLYWVDLRRPALHRLDPADGRVTTWPMPEVTGAVDVANAPQAHGDHPARGGARGNCGVDDVRQGPPVDGGVVRLSLRSRKTEHSQDGNGRSHCPPVRLSAFPSTRIPSPILNPGGMLTGNFPVIAAPPSAAATASSAWAVAVHASRYSGTDGACEMMYGDPNDTSSDRVRAPPSNWARAGGIATLPTPSRARTATAKIPTSAPLIAARAES